jgi:DNA-binding CsgD family transcriptional regulator
MGISVRSVEVSRYRLRRKLGLDSEENLTGFLLRF